MLIRPYTSDDWSAVWSILKPVVREGETYAFPRDMTEAAARVAWTADPKVTFVAEESDSGQIVGTYYLKPNYSGPGAHVSNCGYVVSSQSRGRGVASAMCEHSQEEARRRGFRAMQYNLVASSNKGAVRLWEKLGFAIVGTLPGAFAHPTLGFVDAHVMFKTLAGVAASGE
jgi:L-amino acid N-acyltransferase YncA